MEDGMDTVLNAKRIMILGQPGAGKSYLARELGEILDLREVLHANTISSERMGIRVTCSLCLLNR